MQEKEGIRAVRDKRETIECERWAHVQLEEKAGLWGSYSYSVIKLSNSLFCMYQKKWLMVALLLQYEQDTDEESRLNQDLTPMGPAVTLKLIFATISTTAQDPSSKSRRNRKFSSQVQPASLRAHPYENTTSHRVKVINKHFLSQPINPQRPPRY